MEGERRGGGVEGGGGREERGRGRGGREERGRGRGRWGEKGEGEKNKKDSERVSGARCTFCLIHKLKLFLLMQK